MTMDSAKLESFPDVLTVQEAARILRLGRNAAYEAIRRGEIPSLRIGRRIVIPRTGLERLLGGEFRPVSTGVRPTTTDDGRK
jgi:excisionase family DNA binding protein